MEKGLKETVSDFLKVESSSINSSTVIDRSAVGNSILLHRMYAKFLQQGYEVANYHNIRTYGELMERLNGDSRSAGDIQTGISEKLTRPIADKSYNQSSSAMGVGIDIEAKDNFETAVDYREHAFYKSNFTPQEISYCILQTDALLSFAGLFAAKEALVKADNSYRGINFSSIEIEHTPAGKPYHKNFLISISHTNELAVAVAIMQPAIMDASPQPFVTTTTSSNGEATSSTPTNYSVVALIIALISLAVSLYKMMKA